MKNGLGKPTGKLANGSSDSRSVGSNSPDKYGKLKPVNIYALNDRPDNAGGADLEMLTMRKPPLSAGQNGAGSMFDGPYGGRAPQSGKK
jgi:hypothetical protein